MADVLKATYADLKTVKTRSTCQLILELPIEALTDVVALLGAPVPGNEVWVAIARLRPEAAPAEPEAEHKPRPLSQVAAILCGVVAFRRFLEERYDADLSEGSDAAAVLIRSLCHVSSRSELDTNEVAAKRFREIRTDYDMWVRCAA